MNTSNSTSWWTNKRIFWLTFWAWIFGLALRSENQKTFDTDAVYQVTTYKGQAQIGQPRLETGEALAQKEISKISSYRTLGVLFIVGGAIGTFVIVARISQGQSVFRDAFRS
jgi:hypothetical protein